MMFFLNVLRSIKVPTKPANQSKRCGENRCPPLGVTCDVSGTHVKKKDVIARAKTRVVFVKHKETTRGLTQTPLSAAVNLPRNPKLSLE